MVKVLDLIKEKSVRPSNKILNHKFNQKYPIKSTLSNQFKLNNLKEVISPSLLIKIRIN